MKDPIKILKKYQSDPSHDIGQKLLNEVSAVDGEIGDKVITAMQNPGPVKTEDSDKLFLDMQRNMGVVLAYWNTLKAAVEMMQMDTTEASTQNEDTKKALKKALQMLEQKMIDRDSWYQMLLAEVGSDKKASHDGAMSIWNVIRALQEEARLGQENLEKIRTQFAAPPDMARNFDLLTLNSELSKFGLHYSNSTKATQA